MANPHGTPIWYELVTTDVDAAQLFYADVVGWQVAPFDNSPVDYRILTAPDGQGAGGLVKQPDPDMKPGWYGYIGVDDVDAAAAKVTALGGSVRVAPTDIPGVGRFAFAADPQGLRFYVMKGASEQDSRAFVRMVDGHCDWNEIVTSDGDGALAFYGDLFGWENRERMSMGEMGDYCFLDLGEVRLGALMQARPGWPTRWTYYFRVSSIAAAAERVTAAGGAVTMGPQEVPGGDHIIHGTDPQGIAFALVGNA